jgi:sec-independent protein translocase protein TatB
MDSFFGIGIAELFYIAIIALIFLGPERLPGVFREIAKFIRQIRNISRELTAQFGDEIQMLDELNPRKILQEIIDEPDEKAAATPAKKAAPAKPAAKTTTAKPSTTPKPATPKAATQATTPKAAPAKATTSPTTSVTSTDSATPTTEGASVGAAATVNATAATDTAQSDAVSPDAVSPDAEPVIAGPVAPVVEVEATDPTSELTQEDQRHSSKKSSPAQQAAAALNEVKKKPLSEVTTPELHLDGVDDAGAAKVESLVTGTPAETAPMLDAGDVPGEDEPVLEHQILPPDLASDEDASAGPVDVASEPEHETPAPVEAALVETVIDTEAVPEPEIEDLPTVGQDPVGEGNPLAVVALDEQEHEEPEHEKPENAEQGPPVKKPLLEAAPGVPRSTISVNGKGGNTEGEA